MEWSRAAYSRHVGQSATTAAAASPRPQLGGTGTKIVTVLELQHERVREFWDCLSSCGFSLMPAVYQVVGFGRG